MKMGIHWQRMPQLSNKVEPLPIENLILTKSLSRGMHLPPKAEGWVTQRGGIRDRAWG